MAQDLRQSQLMRAMVSFGLRIFARVLYGALWMIGLLFYRTPFGIKRFWARLGARFWFYLAPFKVRVVLHNLALVFPRKKEESNLHFRRRCEDLALKNLEHMVLVIFEVLERFHWQPSDEGRKFLAIGRENLEFHTREGGQGCFTLTAHLGNWELISWVGVFLNVRLSIVTRFLRNPFFDQLWIQSRRAFGLELLAESGSGIAIVKAIKRGRCVGFIFDQHTGEPHGVLSEFLGLPAWSPKALAIINRRLKAPIVPCYVIRDDQGRTVVHMEPKIEFCNESNQSDAEWMAYHVRTCNDTIGTWIRKHPEQYLWLHKRFKNILNYAQPLPWDA